MRHLYVNTDQSLHAGCTWGGKEPMSKDAVFSEATYLIR